MGRIKSHKYYDLPRTEVVNMLPYVQGRYLEIGCGTGATLEYVKSRGASYVAGVDINKEAVEIASQKKIDLVLVADVECDKLPFEEKEFDCIIMADLLEHLYNPWDALKRISRYLRDDGWILLSIPNVKNYRILIRLVLHDEWTYSEAGLLDNTHLRFFTLKEIKRLLEFAGLRIEELRRNAPLGRKSKILNTLFLNKMMSFWVYQYYILAKKSKYMPVSS